MTAAASGPPLRGRGAELGTLFDALFDGDEPLVARDALSDQHASPEQRFWLLQDIQALIREAVRASSPGPVRRALDRHAADVLLARGALPVEVAQQLADSAEPGDETAIATLLEAADALGASDPASSAELAGRALTLAPARHALRGPLVARRAVSLFAAGLVDDATRFAASAPRQALPPQEGARVRLAVAGIFDVSSDVRADNARVAWPCPGSWRTPAPCCGPPCSTAW